VWNFFGKHVDDNLMEPIYIFFWERDNLKCHHVIMCCPCCLVAIYLSLTLYEKCTTQTDTWDAEYGMLLTTWFWTLQFCIHFINMFTLFLHLWWEERRGFILLLLLIVSFLDPRTQSAQRHFLSTWKAPYILEYSSYKNDGSYNYFLRVRGTLPL